MAQEWIKKLDMRAIDSRAYVIELSGSNQPTAVIARVTVQRPTVIFFDEPTRGIDVGAIAEIHRFINNFAEEGIAVVISSSSLSEIMNLSDRMVVELHPKSWTFETGG